MTASRRQGTLLGFDYGLRRIGVAVGQTITASATPLTILPARDGRPDWEAIAGLVSEWRPAAMVVGVPYHADGTDNDISPRARRFARQLHGRFGCEVHTIDERLSSHAAREAFGRGPREAIDDAAAACILQDWLESPDTAD